MAEPSDEQVRVFTLATVYAMRKAPDDHAQQVALTVAYQEGYMQCRRELREALNEITRPAPAGAERR